MLIGVDAITWVVFAIVTFLIFSKFLFGKIVGLSTAITIAKRLTGSSSIKSVKKKKGKKKK
jgi:hypothetical protein